MSELALGRQVGLGYGGRRIDRHDRALAHVYLLGRAGEAGPWVQGALLEAGMARVYTFADNRSLIAEMLARERQARAGRRGIWADPFFAVRTPEGVDGHDGGFQIVEGIVLKAALVKGRVYLNFGADWKSDFTVTLAPAVRRVFDEPKVVVMLIFQTLNKDDFDKHYAAFNELVRSYNYIGEFGVAPKSN